MDGRFIVRVGFQNLQRLRLRTPTGSPRWPFPLGGALQEGNPARSTRPRPSHVLRLRGLQGAEAKIPKASKNKPMSGPVWTTIARRLRGRSHTAPVPTLSTRGNSECGRRFPSGTQPPGCWRWITVLRPEQPRRITSLWI
jgi:hypothetical protein